jgi:hypothetical protein
MAECADEGRLRREALQIALQLPADEADALIVLRFAEELVRGFLAGRGEKPPGPKAGPLRLV